MVTTAYFDINSIIFMGDSLQLNAYLYNFELFIALG